MTARPSRADLRHGVLARLATYTDEIEWTAPDANLAYADSVIAWADWLARCEEPLPAPSDGGSREAIDAAKAACAEAVAAAKGRGGR